jgi:hypothetical protein
MVNGLTTMSTAIRAENAEAILPLVELCKTGKLFDVQAWIQAGRPVNPPLSSRKGSRAKSPLEIAIDLGFHSLIQVLLQGGAIQEPDGLDSPMNRALRMRRADIVQLLVDGGFDPKSVDMREVFATWDPQLMTYFIDRGADVQTGRPFAHAFCNRIRTALRVFKTCLEHHPALIDQANIALRYHCKEGNPKWVSLMLWVGADPHKPGTENPDETDCAEEDGLSANGFAALSHRFDILALKSMRMTEAQAHPGFGYILSCLTRGEGIEVLKGLLAKGVNPNDQANGGCSTIQSCLNDMGWARYLPSYSWERDTSSRNLDTNESRDRLKAIHLLARHEAKWIPEGKDQLNSARRSLLYLTPEYTMEFVWIMNKYKACDVKDIEALLRTPTMKAHISAHRAVLDNLLASWA